MILKYGCKDISLIAHSMGTRTVCKAILKLNECYINNIKEKKGMKKLFAIDECKRKKLKVLLVAGEAEAEMLENTIKSKVVSHGIVHITNYYVNKRGFAGDIALQFTQLIGLNKATIGMKPVLAQNSNNNNENIINIQCNKLDGGLIGHDYFKCLKKDFADIIIKNKVNPIQRKQNNKHLNCKDKSKNIWILTN